MIVPVIIDYLMGQSVIILLCSCFLSHIGAILGAFLVPILLIIVVNVVIFICVTVVVIRHTITKAHHRNQSITKKEVLRITIGISGVLFIFGLTWSFFILTFSVPHLRETFQILFTVFNSLQGFFIFVFIQFTEGFSHWKSFLSCKKIKFKISTPGTKSSTIPSTLSGKEKNASETSHSNETTELNKEKVELKEQQFSSDIDPSTKLVGIDTSSPVNEIDKSNIAVEYQLQNDQQCIIGSDHEQQDLEELKKQTSTKPLNILIKRYSTKKYKRHHVEEATVHFYEEDSSNGNDDCANA